MKASYLLKQNIAAILTARGLTQHDLAFWCHKSDSWLSKILDDKPTIGKKPRGLPLKYLDRIADFFGIATYQLFQPGISPLTERRQSTRRSGRDRRISQVQQSVVTSTASAIASLTSEDVADILRLKSLGGEARAAVRRSMATVERSGGKTDAPSRGRRLAGPETGSRPGGGVRRVQAIRQRDAGGDDEQ